MTDYEKLLWPYMTVSISTVVEILPYSGEIDASADEQEHLCKQYHYLVTVLQTVFRDTKNMLRAKFGPDVC